MVLNGSTTKGNHLLSWTIKADEAIKNIVIEFSSNGVNFTPLPSLTGISNKFSYKPYQSTTVYYWLRVTSIINQTVYSDTISLKSTENSYASFKVSTLVQNDMGGNLVNFLGVMTTSTHIVILDTILKPLICRQH